MLTISKFTYKNIETKIHLHHPLPLGIMPKLRNVNGFGYSATHNTWYTSYTKTVFLQLKQIDSNLEILQTYNAVMIMRNNSKNTIKIYTPIFKEFVIHFTKKDIEKLKFQEINNYVQLTQFVENT